MTLQSVKGAPSHLTESGCHGAHIPQLCSKAALICPDVQVSADGSYGATYERFHVKVWRPEKPARRPMHLILTKRISVRTFQSCLSAMLLSWQCTGPLAGTLTLSK